MKCHGRKEKTLDLALPVFFKSSKLMLLTDFVLKKHCRVIGITKVGCLRSHRANLAR